MKYRKKRPENWKEVRHQEAVLRRFDLRIWFADWMESNGWHAKPEYVAGLLEARANVVAYLAEITGVK